MSGQYIIQRQFTVRLIRQKGITVFKEHNIKGHFFSTEHANYATNQLSQEIEEKAPEPCSNWSAGQNIFTEQSTTQESATKFSYMLSYKLARERKPFSEDRAVRELT